MNSSNAGKERKIDPATRIWAATLRDGNYQSNTTSKTVSKRGSRATSARASKATSRITSRAASRLPSINNSRSSQSNSVTHSTVTSGKNSPSRKNSVSSIYRPSEKTKLMKKNSKKLRDFAEKRDLLATSNYSKNIQASNVNATSIVAEPVSEMSTPEVVNREVNIKLAQELQITDETQKMNEENEKLKLQEVETLDSNRKRIEDLKANNLARKSAINSGSATPTPKISDEINAEVDQLEAPEFKKLEVPEVNQPKAQDVDQLDTNKSKIEAIRARIANSKKPKAPEIDQLETSTVKQLEAPEVNQLEAPEVEKIDAITGKIEEIKARLPKLKNPEGAVVDQLEAPKVDQLNAPEVNSYTEL